MMTLCCMGHHVSSCHGRGRLFIWDMITKMSKKGLSQVDIYILLLLVRNLLSCCCVWCTLFCAPGTIFSFIEKCKLASRTRDMGHENTVLNKKKPTFFIFGSWKHHYHHLKPYTSNKACYTRKSISRLLGLYFLIMSVNWDTTCHTEVCTPIMHQPVNKQPKQWKKSPNPLTIFHI